jgi:tRNA G10  N-methylase Trm11
MYKYISFYPKGFSSIVETILKDIIGDVSILYKNDSSIVYQTSKDWRFVSKLTFFETSFYLMKLFIEPQEFLLKNMITWAINNPRFYNKIKDFDSNSNTFRIVDSRKIHNKKEFQNEIKLIEEKLESSFRVRIDRGHPDFEVRFIEKENFGFIGIRISKPPQYTDEFQRNSLRKEVASLMIYLSEPSENDVFLDPFCGSGMIPLLRARHSPYKRIIATDKNAKEILKRMKQTQVKLINFDVIQVDLENLSHKVSKNISKIVTDPPWGLIEKGLDIENFYSTMFDQFQKLLVKNGFIILLSNRMEEIEKTVNSKKSYFEIVKKYEVTISGRSSSLFKVKSL